MIFREDIPTDKLNMESRQLATDILQDYMSEINTAEAMFKKVSSNCFFLQY